MTSRFPVLSNLQTLLNRLIQEERDWAHALASLEDRIRSFEEIDQKLYVEWLRLEFGPQLQALEELQQEIRKKQILARRIQELVQNQGMHPREALYVATQGHEPAESEEGSTHRPHDRSKRQWDEAEIEARRQAKREAKREARREAKAEARRQKRAESPSPSEVSTDSRRETIRRKILGLYRALARKLHPDSPEAVQNLTPERMRSLWLEVQAAYRSSNLDQLQAVAVWLERESGDLQLGTAELTPSERYERIRSLTRACNRLERRLAELREDPAWDFGQLPKTNRKKLRRQAALQIDEELVQMRDTWEMLEDFIQSIGTPKAPRKR